MSPRSFASPRRLLGAILLLACWSAPQAGHASPAASHTAQTSQLDGVALDALGQLSLAATAPTPPQALSSNPSFQRYGVFLAEPRAIARPTGSFRVRWDADIPAGTALRVDVRASADGRRWTSWESDVANDATLRFAVAAASMQYRATLLGSRLASPLLRQIDIAPLAEPASYRAQSVQPQPAPTYKVRATRMGMVGGRTANGHIIRPRDHYVSLPSWKSLSSRGGYEYQVRITYRGRSSVAPVWDVGPWNVHDNYWDAQRERFRDLRRGWPQDHAAFYEGYNGRRAEKGYVRFPTAVDIGDGVWWDDLGIRGDQAE
ncbi:MAG: hypothetical protein H7Y32_08025, partial [Chloroflexales bacterium]|nr:hypothetical protein [Chloroflexales bacterium]